MVKPTITFSLTLLLSVTALGPAFAKNEPVELMKYLNPIQERGYRNESQDRLIKKKAFKTSQMPTIKPVPNKEQGFFAIIKPSDNTKFDYMEEVLSKPLVNGLSLTYTWQDLEPTEDNFQWSAIDRALEICAKHNKTAIIRVSTCGIDANPETSDTPKWVFDGGAKSLSYTGTDSKSHQMPVFWDTTYLANWGNFISEFSSRYDKNPNIHSVGITGGGILGGLPVMPESLPSHQTKNKETASSNKAEISAMETSLKKDFGLTQRQLGQHGKYMIDLFAKSFPTARMNLDIDPPTPNRAGQDTLDEISDYAIYRYGQRVFLTRQNVDDGEHGFDQYRVMLKFRPDTLTGLQLTEAVNGKEMEKIAKFALDDGISYAEVPASILMSDDATLQKPLEALAAHLGYQIIAKQAAFPATAISGEPIKASFEFMNFGSANPKRPSRQLDKDIASSFRIQVELKDASGKPVVISYHTPETPTHAWAAGMPIAWQEDLRMPPLAPGEYSVFVSLVDSETKRKLSMIDVITGQEPQQTESISIGKIKIVPTSRSIGSTTPETAPAR